MHLLNLQPLLSHDVCILGPDDMVKLLHNELSVQECDATMMPNE